MDGASRDAWKVIESMSHVAFVLSTFRWLIGKLHGFIRFWLATVNPWTSMSPTPPIHGLYASSFRTLQEDWEWKIRWDNVWPQRGSSKKTNNNAHLYLHLLKLYVLYKPRFGVFMLILYSLLHWSTREAKTNWFSFTAHSIIQGLAETKHKQNQPIKQIPVCSVHVSSCFINIQRLCSKNWNILSTSQLPRHIVLKDALCFHQDLLLRCFFLRGFFLRCLFFRGFFLRCFFFRGFFLCSFFFRGFFLCSFFLRGFFFWKVLQFMAFQVEWALQAVGELDVSAYKGVSSIHSGIHRLQVKVPVQERLFQGFCRRISS